MRFLTRDYVSVVHYKIKLNCSLSLLYIFEYKIALWILSVSSFDVIFISWRNVSFEIDLSCQSLDFGDSLHMIMNNWSDIVNSRKSCIKAVSSTLVRENVASVPQVSRWKCIMHWISTSIPTLNFSILNGVAIFIQHSSCKQEEIFTGPFTLRYKHVCIRCTCFKERSFLICHCYITLAIAFLICVS